MVCITYRFSRGWGLLVMCVVADSFCLDVDFTFGRAECLHTPRFLFWSFGYYEFECPLW